jgi:hypothetical protein
MELERGMHVRVRTFKEAQPAFDGSFTGTVMSIGSKQDPTDGTRHIAWIRPDSPEVRAFIGGRDGLYALGAAHWDSMSELITN